MPSFVCVVENAFFNHNLYKTGDTLFVEDPDLIEKMEGRFVLESDYEQTVRKVVVNLDNKKSTYTKAQVDDTIKEVATENARLKSELKALRKGKKTEG